MKHTVLLLSAACCVCAAVGAERTPLWPSLESMPDRRPNQIAAPLEEARKPGFDAEAHRMPYLEWSEKPAKPNGACVILISGGGYGSTCDGPAFRPLERVMLDNGVTCVWLWYRTPRPKGLEIYRSGWQDGQRAVRLVRAAAEKRGFDPNRIGVLGCSAGSHLSLLLATSALTPAYPRVDATDDIPCHVNWAIPMCPAYVLTDGLDGKNKTDGAGADVALSPAFRFDAKTAPTCLFHGGKDPYSPLGSTALYRAFRRKGVPAELHLDADRGHGPVSAKMFGRAIEFMRQMGFFQERLKPVAQDHRYFPDDTRATERVPLWPAGKTPDRQASQSYEPYLVWYYPEKLKTKAIQVVVPGGGYNFCNINGEGYPVANYFNGKGMTCVVVKYRCPRPEKGSKHLSAWQDAQRAIRLVRLGAAARGLDPDRIGIMGFSAGGHLALMLATTALTPAYAPVDAVDQASAAVQWAFPIYPAYVLTDGANGTNAHRGNLDADRLVSDFAFDAATPPMCLQHGDADPIASMGSVRVWEKTRAMGLQGDLHTYALRGHCFQMSAAPGTGSYTWLDRAWEFLGRKGLNR